MGYYAKSFFVVIKVYFYIITFGQYQNTLIVITQFQVQQSKIQKGALEVGHELDQNPRIEAEIGKEVKVEVVVGVEVGVEEEIGTGREEVDLRVEATALRIARKQNEDQSKPSDSTGLDTIPQILVAVIEGGQEGNNRIPNF